MTTKAYRPLALPAGALVLEDAVRHPSDDAKGTLVRLGNGKVVWVDTLATIRSLPGHGRARGDWGTRVFAARLACGLTQAEAASVLKVTPNTVARWERGEIIPAEIAQAGVLSILHAQLRS